MSACRSTCSTASRGRPAYRALNPQGFVPMLEIDGQRLTQSLAIIDCLDRASPSRRCCRPTPATARMSSRWR